MIEKGTIPFILHFQDDRAEKPPERRNASSPSPNTTVREPPCWSHLRASVPPWFNPSFVMTRKTNIRLAIVAFWLTSMLCLARYEAFPELFTHTLRGYRSVLPESVLMQDSWSRILVADVPAGYSHTSMGVDDEGVDRNIEVHNRTFLKLALAGQPLSIHVHTSLTLDPDYDLLRFDSAVSARGLSLRVTGEKAEGHQYIITSYIGETPTQQRIEIPEDVVLYSPMTALALRQLRPGQELTIKTIDPLSMTSARILVKAVRRESIQTGTNTTEATLLTSSYHGMQLRSWVDKDGIMLRQETPLGWTIEACTPDTALDAVNEDHPPPDLLTQGTTTSLMQLLIGGAKKPNAQHPTERD